MGFLLSNDDPNQEWIVFAFFFLFNWGFYSKKRVTCASDDTMGQHMWHNLECYLYGLRIPAHYWAGGPFTS